MPPNASRSTAGTARTAGTRSTRSSRAIPRLGLAVLAAVFALATTAAVPAVARVPDPPYIHCVITLQGPAAPSARCGAAADTRAGRAGILLMTWYGDAGFGGDSTDIRNSTGPCDAGPGGYGIPDIGGLLGRGWNDSISSFRTFGRCTVVRGFEDIAYGGASHIWTRDQPYVGDRWNDRVSSFLMHA